MIYYYDGGSEYSELQLNKEEENKVKIVLDAISNLTIDGTIPNLADVTNTLCDSLANFQFNQRANR